MKVGSTYRAWTTVAALTLGGSPFVANAADSAPSAPEDVATKTQALDLFRRGRAALEAKDYAAAVVDFEQSFRLDPGGGTQLNLALAYELTGKTATAWAAFHKALRMARLDGRADRVKEAEANIGELETRLSRLRVVVPQAARIVGLTVLRDGIALDEASWDEAVPADPGEHRIEATAPGKKPWHAMVTLGDNADRKEVALEALADDPSRPIPLGTVTAFVTPQVTPMTAAPPREAKTWQRPAAYAALGAAAGLVAVGIVSWRVHEDNAAVYNNDKLCFYGTESRDERCGGHAQATNIALVVEVGAFALAGIAGAAGTWLLWNPGPKPNRVAAASCAPSAGLGVLCQVSF
jgi:tetratricopeptide (TPR) repeat protein